MAIPKDVRDRIVISKYMNGDSVKDIMLTASIRCPNTLYKVLKAHSIPLRRPRDGATMDEMVGPVSYLLFEEGKEPAEVALALGRTVEFIERVIEERL